MKQEPIEDITNDFIGNLNDRINELVSNALNETSSILNSSNTMLSNGSNLTSNQIVVSNNNVSSFASNSNNSAGLTLSLKIRFQQSMGYALPMRLEVLEMIQLASSGYVMTSAHRRTGLTSLSVEKDQTRKGF